MAGTKRRHCILAALLLASLGTGFGAVQHVGESSVGKQDELFRIPPPQVEEHAQLHEDLQAAVRAGGQTAQAAQQVQQHLAAHFAQENHLVMPMLGLLRPMAKSGVTEAMRPAIARGEQISEKLEQFLEEHGRIAAAVNELEAAAESEGKAEHAAFARRLRTHAQAEEAVLYPAAIMIGRHVKSQLPARD